MLLELCCLNFVVGTLLLELCCWKVADPRPKDLRDEIALATLVALVENPREAMCIHLKDILPLSYLFLTFLNFSYLMF